MLRVTSNSIIVPPLDCAWLSLHDYQLNGSCCLQFECKGENDVTIILKPIPGAKRWQHLQRQQGPAGAEQFAVEANYTVILGSHRNSKLKIEKNGEEKAVATGLPGCTVTTEAFTACWINYNSGCIAIGTGPVGSNLSYIWQDPQPAIPDIQHVGLSCWDKHVSYRNVQLLPPLPQHQLQELRVDLQRKLAAQPLPQRQPSARLQAEAHRQPQQSASQLGPPVVPLDNTTPGSAHAHQGTQQQRQQDQLDLEGPVHPLLQLVQHAVVSHLQPADVCHMLQLSEALLPRTQHLYDEAVQLAGEWFSLLAQQHLQEIAMLPMDVLMDVVHEPLLDVSELAVFNAVAAWCTAGSAMPAAGNPTFSSGQQQDLQLSQSAQQPQQQIGPPQEQQQPAVTHGATDAACCRGDDEVLEVLQLVRFALMTDAERQAVLDHPFTRACPLVQQCLEEDLQRLQDYHSGLRPSADSGVRCQQRRLVLPACAATGQPARSASTADAALPGSAASTAQGSLPSQPTGSSGSKEAQASTSACRATAGAPSTGQTAGTESSSSLQQQGNLSSSVSRGPSGWLHRSGSSGSGKPSSSWRSYRRRVTPSCKELMYVCDGDRNGVIHYIATEYGSKPWVNPVLSKALEIKASSPSSRFTDPKALVSGQFINTSFAGPRYVRPPPAAAGPAAAAGPPSTPSTWWQLDLGPQHRLVCNYYVLRHDGSQEGYARSWSLQGSNDLQHWLDLRRHADDTTIRLPGMYGSWSVAGPAACMPFRAFRLLLTGPTQSQTNPWAFCLSYWELYGYFYKLRNAGSSPGSGTVNTAPAQ